MSQVGNMFSFVTRIYCGIFLVWNLKLPGSMKKTTKKKFFRIVLGLVFLPSIAFCLWAIFGISYGEPCSCHSVKTELNAIAIATQLYRIENPGSCPTLEVLFEKKYLRAKPDDPWDNKYIIRCTKENISVLSYGPDEQKNTDDDLLATIDYWFFILSDLDDAPRFELPTWIGWFCSSRARQMMTAVWEIIMLKEHFFLEIWWNILIIDDGYRKEQMRHGINKNQLLSLSLLDSLSLGTGISRVIVMR